MIFLAVVISYLNTQERHADALPVASTYSYVEDLLSPRDGDESFDDRSVLSILWSCLSTLFLCSWVALHLDVPPLGRSKWWMLRFRLKMMVYVLLVPEIVIWWAARQYLCAKVVMKRQNERGHKWTMTHAFFYIMGGFALNANETSRKVLRRLDENGDHWDSKDTGSNSYRDEDICWPIISEEEIMDRSKADVLSKGITLLQTSWFVAQCISRLAFRISITELEVVTLAFATLNGLVYFLWWNKPCDVRFVIPVSLKAGETRLASPPLAPIPPTESTENPSATAASTDSLHLENDKSDAPSPVLDLSPSRTHPVPAMRSSGHHLSHSLLPPSQSGLLHRTFLTKLLRTLRRLGGRVINFFYTGTLDLMFFFLEDLLDMLSADGNFLGDEDVTGDNEAGFALAAIVVFGSIHFIGWSYLFPSLTEKWLWRAATISICGVPLMIFLKAPCIVDFWTHILARLPTQARNAIEDFFRYAFLYLPFIVYLASRLILLVLPLLSLRSLPASALLEVKWTTLLPHI